MPTNKHIMQQIERYLDRQLSGPDSRHFEEHVAACPTCAHALTEARQIRAELGPLLREVLGHPTPPPALRHKVRRALQDSETGRPWPFSWGIFGRLLSPIGTMALLLLLGWSALWVVHNGILPVPPPITAGNDLLSAPAPLTIALPPTSTVTRPPTSVLTLHDSLPNFGVNQKTPVPQAGPTSSATFTHALQPASEVVLPGGTIAFPLFNTAPHRQVYELHLIHPNGNSHRLFPLDGVSEPAIRPALEGYTLAYRAWGEPTSPRALLTSPLDGERPDVVTRFWEDAQPDWSPTENRLIFASQRESDRHWRLYTAWGDGSTELNLRREGKNPTFAPDGFRFAFESCDPTGEHCGLWASNLDQSEHVALPFLEDPLAQAPDWAPLSEEIVYMANPNNNWDLYLTDSAGSTPRRLTTSTALDGLPTWSPDGQWVAFLSDRGGQWGIWLIHIASHQLHPVYTFGEGEEIVPPQRSPYGERSWKDEQLSWSR